VILWMLEKGLLCQMHLFVHLIVPIQSEVGDQEENRIKEHVRFKFPKINGGLHTLLIISTIDT